MPNRYLGKGSAVVFNFSRGTAADPLREIPGCCAAGEIPAMELTEEHVKSCAIGGMSGELPGDERGGAPGVLLSGECAKAVLVPECLPRRLPVMSGRLIE
jgi:hypothetical protein